MMTEPDTNQVVVITGASSGIGASTARLFAARGKRLVLAARSVHKLEVLRDEISAAGGEAVVIVSDLSQIEEAEALVARTVDAFGRIDVLVNNAGYGTQCRFEDMSSEAVARMFTVNVLSPMAASRAAAQIMVRQGSGSIINVASVGGVVGHPLNVAYCATKHALVGFSKSLRLELKGSGVRVTAVCPSATRTEFFTKARTDIPFDKMIEKFAVAPEKVAQSIEKASHGNRAVVFPTWSAWFLPFADRPTGGFHGSAVPETSATATGCLQKLWHSHRRGEPQTGALLERRASPSGLGVFLDDKVGSTNPDDLFLEVHDLVWADRTADEPSASLAAGLIPIEIIVPAGVLKGSVICATAPRRT